MHSSIILPHNNTDIYFPPVYPMICCKLTWQSIAEYDIDNGMVNSYIYKSMGIDCGFGSSAFGIMITRMAEGKIQILFADEFEKPDYNEMLQKVLS